MNQPASWEQRPDVPIPGKPLYWKFDSTLVDSIVAVIDYDEETGFYTVETTDSGLQLIYREHPFLYAEESL